MVAVAAFESMMVLHTAAVCATAATQISELNSQLQIAITFSLSQPLPLPASASVNDLTGRPQKRGSVWRR